MSKLYHSSKKILAFLLFLAAVLVAPPVLAQSGPAFTVSLGIGSISPNPAQVNAPVTIVPMVQPEGNTGGVLPSGSVVVKVLALATATSTPSLYTSCHVAMASLAAGCAVTVADPGEYDVQIHYDGDSQFAAADSSMTKLYVIADTGPPPTTPGGGFPPNSVPTLGHLAMLLLSLLMGLGAMAFLRTRS